MGTIPASAGSRRLDEDEQAARRGRTTAAGEESSSLPKADDRPGIDDAGLAPLAALRFAVRIDQPGTRLRDFQTAHHGAKR